MQSTILGSREKFGIRGFKGFLFMASLF